MIIDLFRQGLSAQEIVYYLIIFLFALTLSFSLHEFMHAAVAVWLGDPTPKNMGRLTLNPVAHFDPVGESRSCITPLIFTGSRATD